MSTSKSKIFSRARLSLVYSVLGTLAMSSVVFAANTNCPTHFFDGKAPDILNKRMLESARELCYTEFAVDHSGITRTPIFAAEHLTQERIIARNGLKRDSEFHPDPHLPVNERAELEHYARSGYDRGHVAPSADMSTKQSQEECFSLANMVPQAPANNRGVWANIENAVRNLATESGDIYVITGPIFSGGNLKQLGGAVLVPTYLFKAVYDTRTNQAGAYVVENTDTGMPKFTTIAEVEKLTSLNLFPSMPQKVKEAGMRLPEPKKAGRSKKNAASDQDFWDALQRR